MLSEEQRRSVTMMLLRYCSESNLVEIPSSVLQAKKGAKTTSLAGTYARTMGLAAKKAGLESPADSPGYTGVHTLLSQPEKITRKWPKDHEFKDVTVRWLLRLCSLAAFCSGLTANYMDIPGWDTSKTLPGRYDDKLQSILSVRHNSFGGLSYAQLMAQTTPVLAPIMGPFVLAQWSSGAFGLEMVQVLHGSLPPQAFVASVLQMLKAMNATMFRPNGFAYMAEEVTNTMQQPIPVANDIQSLLRSLQDFAAGKINAETLAAEQPGRAIMQTRYEFSDDLSVLLGLTAVATGKRIERFTGTRNWMYFHPRAIAENIIDVMEKTITFPDGTTAPAEKQIASGYVGQIILQMFPYPP